MDTEKPAGDAAPNNAQDEQTDAMIQKSPEKISRMKRVQRMMELGCFVACILLTIAQQCVLNYYFVHYTRPHRFAKAPDGTLVEGEASKLSPEAVLEYVVLEDNFMWLLWIIADVVVIIVMLYMRLAALPKIRISIHKICHIQLNLGYAYIAWFAYSLLLSAKVSVAVFVYADKLTATEKFGVHTYFLFLGLSAVIFLLLVLSHHYNRLTSSRKKYLSYLTMITLDILDSVNFLDLLYLTDITRKISFDLKISILVFVCFNFMLPTLPLLRLRYHDLFPKIKNLSFEFPIHKLYYFVVNIPYLVIRIYLWNSGEGESHVVGIFLIKNLLMIVIVLREFWVAYLKSHDQCELQPVSER